MPSIALVLIARDEARCIERCLASAREHVDVMLVLDTGSHDDTRRVVKQAAGLLPAIVLSHFVSEGSPRLFWRPKRPRTAPSKTRWSDWAESSNLKNRIWSNSGTRWIRSPIIGCL